MGAGFGSSYGWWILSSEIRFRKKVPVCAVLSLVFPNPGIGGMILTFADGPLTNTVSRLCLRFFATTPRRLLLGKGDPQAPGHD